MLARLRFRHRIGLLLSLAATALIAVTIVTLILGRRSGEEMTGIETKYVPLLELDRDLKRISPDIMKALEDAAGAAEESKLEEAAHLRSEFLQRLAAGRPEIVANGADPDKVVAAFEEYYTSARALSTVIIAGTPMTALGREFDEMQRARRAYGAALNAATRPDRDRLAAAFATARASQQEALTIDIAVAATACVLMALLSWRLIRRTVRSLQAVSDGVERLARGDFAQTIDVPQGDEIGDLAREANRTAARLREYREQADREAQRAQTALVEAQRQARAAEMANHELEAFSYSVSHDLRAPLRAINGFSTLLLEQEEARLSPEAREHVHRIVGGAARMGELIDDLLRLARVSGADVRKERVDLSAMVASVALELRKANPERPVELVIQDDVTAFADTRLIHITLENLLGNAWKFTSKTEAPRISFGAREEPEGTVYFLRDNGAGFDMQYAERLFGAFQRLHSEKEFPGTGIGLATVQRIVTRHGGRIWVDASIGKGANFQFTLPPES